MDFVLDALEQALYARRLVDADRLVHHSDTGVQYVSIRCAERLVEAGLEPSVASVGDSYDNALAETINGLYKAEVIHRRSSWHTREQVEWATLHRVVPDAVLILPADPEGLHVSIAVIDPQVGGNLLQ